MELKTAVALIEKGVTSSSTPQVWADLGAGTGLFTKALSTLLPAGSTIYAMDQDKAAINSIVLQSPNITLKTAAIDFVKNELNIIPLNGMIMANALHFVRDKKAFMEKIKRSLIPSGKILIIEYDRKTSNPWVPFPINYLSLQQLGSDVGFISVDKLATTPSNSMRRISIRR
jgi:ubiquinone/menaquinone biosynthesis C-methylase UbiE